VPSASFEPPRKLGVGFPFLPSLPTAFYSRGDLIDFVEISPDTLCREQRDGNELSLVFIPALLEKAMEATAGLPIVVHGVELSIGSVSGWNSAYLDMLDTFFGRRSFVWHSEHLGFQVAASPHGPINAGVPLPIPFTREALDLIVPRAATLSRRYGVPFLLENTVYYLPQLPSDDGRDEIAFLNDLVERSGCGLLLDLFNLYCNGLHHGFDPTAVLDRLRLDRVVEIHIAGGATHENFLLDSHSEVVPDSVWNLLEHVVPRTPNLAGIVYEVLDEAFANVGVEQAYAELHRAKAIWRKCSTS
jgi:uncharacterized protein